MPSGWHCQKNEFFAGRNCQAYGTRAPYPGNVQRRNGSLIYSASDLNDYLECPHLTGLRRRFVLGEIAAPSTDGDRRQRELLSRKGDEHEQRYLAKLKAGGASVEELPARVGNDESFAAAQDRTLAAIERGAAYIFQPTFFDGTFLGRADFLRRVDRPCAARGWSYEVIDTKLARSTKAYFLVQLSSYSEHLAGLQGGTMPERMHVALGSGEERSFFTRDYLAYYRHLRASFLASAGAAATYPNECGHCKVCDWERTCDRQRRDDDHLSLVAWMRRDQADKLTNAGIATLTALASAPNEARPFGFNEDTFAGLRLQASLQVAGRTAREHHLLPYDARAGLALLPAPDEGDIYFDMEGDPYYAPDTGLEYLFGAYLPNEDRYVPFWAASAALEKRAMTDFLDFVIERQTRFPNLHVYHYANYEKAALGRLTMRYAARREELDVLLRAGVFVDLFTVVRQGIRVSAESYSIKKLEPFYGFKRKAAVARGDDSIVAFEEFLDNGDETILADIQEYNDEDCRSTYDLHRWLMGLRADLSAKSGVEIPWYAPEPPAEPAPTLLERRRTMVEVRDAILDGMEPPFDGAAAAALADSDRLRWFLANAVDYHWNESKPEWWRFHYRKENVDELVEFDHDSLGGLRVRDDIEPRKEKKSYVYTFAFPPQQHKFRAGDSAVDPDTGKGAGTVMNVDDEQRVIELKCSGNVRPSELRALIPPGPRSTQALEDALLNIGRQYLDGTLERERPAIVDVLLAKIPRLRDRVHGAAIQPQVVDGATLAQTILALDRSYLVVQGPPGSGKSTTGGEAIAELLAAGKRVGIMARSHKAAHNLVHAVERAAAKRALIFSGAHKDSDDDEAFVSELGDAARVKSVQSNEEALDERNRLVSGTPWLFSRADAQGAFDVLVVDEAGQLALAEAVGCARAADNLVLLGDPLQLAQVSQGSHPPGIGRSILEHLLGDHLTIPPERGIFLPKSYRMHPAICRYISEAVYEGRLESVDGNDVNAVTSPGLHGSGLRYIPVDHVGNRRESVEEADAIVAAITSLREGSFVLRGAAESPIRDEDILVVSPYNAQRALLQKKLAGSGFSGIRVGTVDKFQGQQAPVLFYSMATSSGEDVPRDMEFLFEKNRFNVAISRAQCLSILVCSPRLLEIRCRTPEQMALVNLLCDFCELSTAMDRAAAP
jgi:predicted RecB family nuclease